MKNLSDKSISILMYLAFAAVSVFYGIHLCVPLVLDEVGTIANTAFLAGDDWSICVQTMGGFYYKYGQSLLYLPIYLLFKHNPFRMYKVIMAFHMFCISFIPVIAYNIVRKYLKVESKVYALFLAVAGTAIPSMWLYTMYARGDMMLILLPWVLVLIILKLSMDEDMKGKKFVAYSILLAAVSVYSYMAHSRGIVLLIATVMTIAIVHIWFKKKMVVYSAYVPVTVVLMVIDKFVSRYVKHGVYGKYGTKHASVENFDIETFMKIFTPKGAIIQTKLFIGWLFNLFASTYGLAIIGFIAAAVIILRTFKERKGEGKEIFAVFSLLCLLGTFFLGALFFFPHAWEFFNGIDLKRSDRMMYGRYVVGSVTPICTLALFALTNKKEQIIKIKSKISSVAVYTVTLFAFVKWVCPQLQNKPATNSRYFLSLTSFLDIVKSRTNDAFPHLVSAMFKAGLFALAIMLIILILTETKKEFIHICTFAIILVVSVGIINNVFVKVRNDRDNRITDRMSHITKFINHIDGIGELSEKYPCVYRHDDAVLVKLYQFVMNDYNVGGINYVKDQGQTEFFVIASKKYVKRAIDECNSVMGEGNFYMFTGYDMDSKGRDIILVRGENLKEDLIKKENELVLFTPDMYEGHE
ncbi:MAG: hypothetical protein E7254_04450 [Lachnospiraceae bacterium]|nr:hypothetical protein [Lachnospiraceae bacterium]